MNINHINHPRRALGLLTLGLGLALAGSASAQCMSDDDCADGERCNDGLVLIQCLEPPCEGPQREGGVCVNELLNAPCESDADCGAELSCLNMLVAEICPEDGSECRPAPAGEGYCVDNTVLAASSGLAPMTASASDQPPVMEAGLAGAGAPQPQPQTETPPASNESAGGCTVAAGPGSVAGLAWMAAAIVALRRRRGR